MQIETATLGGGCFWCLDAVFRELKGVQSVISGYAGGARADPTYQQVCTGATGHAEVVRIEFDAEQIDYATLLQVFFGMHDPTTVDRQGADVGSQYRSVIFHHSDAQRVTAERTIQELDAAGVWSSPIVTRIEPAPAFYPAEDYHQDYYRRNPGQGYCRMVISPKAAKLRERHAALLRN
ncbi:peptide-methionine (S)-S-oxide reductase MsrA [Imhoffiella purpurea]|uniref:Peptide methionine sulfoxide reductase MsrA n=1 Tax=Imhoffiella purpurea TaxID=1249627 RepID=W9V3Z2_9GAMM|nr:peptide-methionine (S)-S-oxide reductase MsrA [Imhoffiella purpurea]EXJ14054.1 Peptide methionine sulfoxide reductase MsrA [Imhoffiella purpurea]